MDVIKGPILLLALIPLVAPLVGPLESALAQAPGSAGYRTRAEESQEFISKLRRDITKVAHAVEVTKELIGRSRGAPYLPDIYLRLAELYVEQARYEFYLVHEQQGEASKGSAVVPTARLLKEKAVETYERILADWPEHKDSDKVLFFLGHELRELGRYDEMIKRYEELVSKHPKSSLVLDCYLVLGDHRFDKQDLIGAKRYYQKILDSPTSSAHDLANFKMGWVFLNEADYKEALLHFESAAGSSTDPGDAPTRHEQDRLVSVKREALVDLVYAYTEERKPDGALAYFRKLATSRNNYLLALRKLANRYFVKQNFDAAAMAYREIASLSYDAEENLEFASRIYESTNETKNYSLVQADVATTLRALDTYRFDWRAPKSQRDAAEHDFELRARDLATKAQAYALEKKDKTLSPKVARAYARYLESFPKSGNKRAIVENLADTLFEAQQFIRAADRYEEAAEFALANNDDKAREEALYNACAAFYEALKNSLQLPRFQRVWAQEGLKRLGGRYVESFPASSKVAEIKLNIGRSYYESGEFEKAIGIFDEFVANYPGDARAVTVADLILDSYNQKQDYAGLAERAKKLAAIGPLGDAAFKQRMLQTAKRAEERQIGEVILTASVDTRSTGNAGEELRKYWEQNRDSPVAEKTLYTAFVQYKESRDFDKTFDTGNQFIGAYPKSQYLGDVFGTLAGFTTQTGEYAQAAVYLEEFHKRFPNDPSAQRMLGQAGIIRQLSGDHRAAIQSFVDLASSVRDPKAQSTWATKMLESYEAIGDWSGMQAAATRILVAQPDHLHAHLMLGLSLAKAGDLDGGLRSLQAAVRIGGGRRSDNEAQDDAARAAFGIGDLLYRQFEKISSGVDLQASVQQKAQLLQKLEAALVDAVAYNRGEWAVAALHRVALAYQHFANFLEKAPTPEGLSPQDLAEYKKLLAEQVGPIRAKADEFFTTCVNKAHALTVFSGAVLGCLARGPEQNTPTVQIQSAVPPEQKRKELKDRLTKDPKDLSAMADLTDFFLATGKPAMAKLLASKALEIDERDARFLNKMGAADLLLGHPQDAYLNFRRAADLNHPYALANVLALMISFKDPEGAKRAGKDATLEDLPRGAPDLHPEAASALALIAQ